ncbi:MAG: hypothetical protein SPC28_08840 [Alloprevotella sp.]|nr:hypothetical protein [Alloprevotella sp.]
MKKKKYNKPQLSVYEIESPQLLAGSGGATESIGFGGSGEEPEPDDNGTYWGQ